MKATWLTGIAAVIAAAAFVALDPARTVTPELALGWLRAAGVAGISLLAALGGGAAVLDRVAPAGGNGETRGEGETRGDGDRWVRALATGIGLHTAAMFALLVAGAVNAWSSLGVVVLLSAGWLTRPRLPLPRVGPSALLVGGLLLAPALIDALAPPTDTDEIYYQLAAPRFLLDHGGLPGGFLHPDQSRPLPIHLVHAGTLALGGEAGPRLWHLGVGIALLLGVRSLAARRFGEGHGDLPALAIAGSLTFLREAGLAYADLAVALLLLVAAEATLARRWRELGWMAGLALAAKYTAAPAVAGMFLVAGWDALRPGAPTGSPTGSPTSRTRALARVVIGGLLALVPVAPWLARNALSGLHPLFPFAGWPDAKDFVFVYPEKYGAGHGWLDAALLPLRVVFAAEPDSFVFFGRISLLWLGLAAAAILAARARPDARRLVFVVALGFVGWASAAQLLRYLLPLAGVAGLAGGAARPRWPMVLLFAASLPANLGPAWERAAARLPVVTGAESADTFLERELPAWPAVRWVREQVPADEPVALLNAWPGYWIPQPYVLGSVEDHVPTRHWIWAHGDDALRALHREGVRWLVVGEIKYLRKSYAFLDDAVFAAQLRQPQADLERLLLRDAERVFRAQHYSVWRLDDPPPVP